MNPKFSSARGKWIAATVAGAALLTISAAGALAQDLVVVLSDWNYVNEYGWKQTIEQYQLAHPDVHLIVQTVPGDVNTLREKVAVMIAAGAQVDVVAVHNSNVAQLMYAGLLAPIDTMAKTAGVDLADFPPTILSAFQAHGKTYAVPHDFAAHVIGYDKTRFDAVGVAAPTANWTWDDLVADAKKAQVVDAQGNHKVWGFGNAFTDFWHIQGLGNVIWANGGEYFSPGAKRLMLDTPEARAAIDFIVRNRLDTHLFESWANVGQNAAMSDVGSFQLQNMKDLADEVKYVPYPKGPAGSFNMVGLWGYGVAATSKQQAAAFDFVKFATGQAYLDNFVAHAGALPASYSGLKSAQWNRAVDAVWKDAALWSTAVQTGRALNAGPNTTDVINKITAPAWAKVWDGSQSAAQFVNAVEAPANQMLAQAQDALQ